MINSIVLIFDKILCPHTTGTHCIDALKELNFKYSHFEPFVKEGNFLKFKGYNNLPQDFDLYLQIDDDLFYPAPNINKPKAYWCIDTHRIDKMFGGGNRIEKSKYFDYVFTTQLDGSKILNAEWIPLAFNNKLHNYKKNSLKKYDWCFIGNITENRKKILHRLKYIFPNCFIGNAYRDEMVEIFNSSKIILNISVNNDINMRMFESQACGGLLITNKLNNGEEKLFNNLVTYNNEEDLIKHFYYYLNNQEKLKEKSELQYLDVINKHSYKERLKKIIRIIESY